MASSTDFKKLYDLYQSEGVKKGIPIVQFCNMNGIVYSHFGKPPIPRMAFCSCMNTFVSELKQLPHGNKRIF